MRRSAPGRYGPHGPWVMGPGHRRHRAARRSDGSALDAGAGTCPTCHSRPRAPPLSPVSVSSHLGGGRGVRRLVYEVAGRLRALEAALLVPAGHIRWTSDARHARPAQIVRCIDQGRGSRIGVRRADQAWPVTPCRSRSSPNTAAWRSVGAGVHTTGISSQSRATAQASAGSSRCSNVRITMRARPQPSPVAVPAPRAAAREPKLPKRS